MSISFDPTTHSTGSWQALLYAVVEYLKSTKHLTDPVDHKPEHDGQYRLVCLAPDAEDAARLAHLLRAMDDGTYWYSVCVAEPEHSLNDDVNSQVAASEPLNLVP